MRGYKVWSDLLARLEYVAWEYMDSQVEAAEVWEGNSLVPKELGDPQKNSLV